MNTARVEDARKMKEDIRTIAASGAVVIVFGVAIALTIAGQRLVQLPAKVPTEPTRTHDGEIDGPRLRWSSSTPRVLRPEVLHLPARGRASTWTREPSTVGQR